MELAGFENVFQLDGGILNYFEECGGAHYEGDCFVFDKRVGVDSPSRDRAALCFVCRSRSPPPSRRPALRRGRLLPALPQGNFVRQSRYASGRNFSRNAS